MKVLVLGDTHGSKGTVKRAIETAAKHDATAIVQVGDFGYWEHSTSGGWFLESVSKRSVEADIPFFWIDGNHENHTMLRRDYGPGGRKHKPSPEGFWEIRPLLYYIPRGTKWTWDDCTFMGVGGAYSIDKAYRLEKEAIAGSSRQLWWPEEQITDEELEFVKSQGTADVLFTHDCPTNAPFRNRIKPDLDSQMHRQRIDEIGWSVKPKWWFHGHMHEKYVYEFYTSREDREQFAKVRGLECDGMVSNWCVFDTDLIK